MRRFRDYDPFAWLYNRYWASDFHRAVLPVLDRTVLAKLAPGAAILDLCCGDGRLAASLARRGFRVTGLDGSAQMLSFARRRAPETQFLLADAREFRLPRSFHAVLSLFDSLNHVMKTEDLEKVFGNVWRCLKPGGVFLFDLNSEQAYREMWSQTASTVDVNVVSVAKGSYSAERRIAICDITLMRLKNDLWSRSDFRMRQKLHPREAVLKSLKSAQFEACMHAASQLGMQGDLAYGRDFYIAKKEDRSQKTEDRILHRPPASGRKQTL
ncbi:MAG TPA: class I SAM-dependent methyltransferase [Bryobacteraceae bacterium]|nr:class I SAM-dependent methyltransferase [Bryobacteraceae bacterium]